MDIPCELISPDDPSKARVKYACPGCKAPLASPMADAGQTDRCPDCGTVFRVPGVEAFAAHRAAIEGKRRTEEQNRQDEIHALPASMGRPVDRCPMCGDPIGKVIILPNLACWAAM